MLGCAQEFISQGDREEALIPDQGEESEAAELRRAGEISISSDMQMTPPLWQKVKRNSKAS